MRARDDKGSGIADASPFVPYESFAKTKQHPPVSHTLFSEGSAGDQERWAYVWFRFKYSCCMIPVCKRMMGMTTIRQLGIRWLSMTTTVVVAVPAIRLFGFRFYVRLLCYRVRISPGDPYMNSLERGQRAERSTATYGASETHRRRWSRRQ